MKPPRFLSPTYRALVAALFLGLLPVLIYGALEAWKTNANRVRDWLPASFPETQALYWFASHFGSNEMLMISWPGCELGDDRLARLADGLTRPPPERQHPLFRQALTGPEVLKSLTEPPLELPRAEAIDRLGGWLIGPDGRTTCVLALVSEVGEEDRHAAVDWAYAVAWETCGLRKDEIFLAGSTADSVAIDRTSERYLNLFNTAAFVIAFLLLWRFFGSMWLALLVTATALVAEQFALAAVFFTGAKLDSVMLTMASLVFVLSVSAAVHLVNYYGDAVHETDLDAAPALASRHALLPCALAACTTSLGLGSLTISKMVPIAKFGFYSAIAVIGSVLILFLLLPVALKQWPPRRWAAQASHRSKAASHRWNRLLSIVGHNRRWVIAATAVVLCVVGAGIPRINTAIGLHDLFRHDAKIIKDYNWLEDHIGPLVPLETVIRFPGVEPEAMLDRMLFVEQIRGRLAAMDEVGATVSAATFAPPLPRRGWAGLGNATRKVVLQRKLARHRDAFADAGYLRIADDAELWRISVRVPASENVDLDAFLDKLPVAVDPLLARDLTGPLSRATAVHAGGVPLVHKAQAQLLEDLIDSFFLAFALVAITMVLLLRSVTAGLLTMIPNLFPSLMIFGSMGWLGFDVEIGSMLTASTALGIAVDDTLHFVIWFRRALARGYSRAHAVGHAYRRCGTAMLQTSSVCGFGLLIFVLSPFIPSARFACLMFLMLATALIGDLIVLPAILLGPIGRVFEPKKKANAASSQ
jgi:hypothetical protein